MADRCGLAQNQTLQDFPWSVNVNCERKQGHHNKPGKKRVHVGRYGPITVMWLTKPDLP